MSIAAAARRRPDGANAGVSFDSDGGLRLQSRGHVLSGGPRERQFAPMKAWAAALRPVLSERLGTRYVLYGEWLYAKHTVFYDALPHYFCEFDVLDQESGGFLSTAARARLLAGTPVVSVPVLYEGTLPDLGALTALLGPSRCRGTGWAASASPRTTGPGSPWWGWKRRRPWCWRNRSRADPVPRQVIERLVGKWEAPDPTYAHDVRLLATDCSPPADTCRPPHLPGLPDGAPTGSIAGI
jgi:hypothetical protein